MQRNNLSQFIVSLLLLVIALIFMTYITAYFFIPTNRDLSKIDATAACENTTNKRV